MRCGLLSYHHHHHDHHRQPVWIRQFLPCYTTVLINSLQTEQRMGSICVLATWLYLPVSCELHEWSSTDCQSRRLHSHRDQPLKRGCNSHTDRQATHANCVIYAEVSAHTPNGFRKLTRLPYCTITTASGMFVATAFRCQHISFPGARSPAYSSGRYTGEEGDSGRKIWQVSSDKPVARRRNV